MKILLSGLFFCCLSILSCAAPEMMKEITWSWVPVSRGTITRDSNDETDLAVISDTKGLAAFNSKYGIDIKASAEQFTNNIIVVVFSAVGLGIDGVGQGRRDEYCISMYDLGIDIEMVAPTPGKSYVALHPISLPKQIADGKIFIRQPQPAKRIDFKR